MRYPAIVVLSSVVTLIVGACATPTVTQPEAVQHRAVHAQNGTTSTNTTTAAASVETTATDSASRSGIGYGSGH